MKQVQLRFHRFFSTIIMPLNVFAGIYSLLTAVRSCTEDGFSVFNTITLTESIVVLLLVFCTFRGLFTFRRSSLITLIALMALKAADNIWALVLSIRNSLPVYIVSSVTGIVFAVLVSVYYLRRRFLFSKEGAKVVKMTREDWEKLRGKMEEKKQPLTKEGEDVNEEEEAVPEYDCPRCGFHITDGAVFCPKCGCQTRKVNH